MDYLSAIVLLDAFLSVVVIYVITKMNSRLWIKYALIPIVVFATYFSINSFDSILGFPYKHEPVGDFELVTHRVVISGKGEIMLQVWGIQQGQSRLYQFAYSPNLDQAFTKAEGLKGHRMVFNLHKKGKKGRATQFPGANGELGSSDDTAEYEMFDRTPTMPPKDEEPN